MLVEFRWLPNAVSLIRLFFILPYGWLYFSRPESIWPFLFALLIILGDTIDGALARRLHAESKLGTALDTIADDAVLVASWIFFFLKGLYGLWFLALLLMPRIIVRLSAAILRIITKKWHIEHLFGDRLGAGAQYIGILWILAYFPQQMELLYGLIAIMYAGTALSIVERTRKSNS